MAEWRTPVFDRTMDDVKSVDRTSAAYQKGALNADDLNRIEDNYKYLMAKLKSDAIFIPHRLRNFTETVLEYVEKDVSLLPDGYIRLGYIESTGTQYIDTGFKHNQDTRVVMDAQVTAQPSSHAWLFEGRITTGTAHKSVFLLSGTTWSADYFNGAAGNRVTISSTGITDRLRIDYNKNTLTVNDFTHTWAATTFQSNYTLALFGANSGGTVTGFISAKLYSCKIYDDGTMIRDFVPCLDANGVAGLYDLVEGKFYKNAGTGSFSYLVLNLPEGYTRVEYIQSTGTQHIDTGFKPNQNSRVVMDAQMTSSASSQFYFGTRTLSSTLNYNVLINSTNHRSDYGESKVTISGVPVTDRCLIDKNKNVCKVNDTTVINTSGEFQASDSLFLCAVNQGGEFSMEGIEFVSDYSIIFIIF